MKKNNIDKTSSIIKLVFWLIFIGIVIFLIKFNSNSEKELIKEDVLIIEKKSALDILNSLNNNYRYNYDIKINEDVYNFTGARNNSKESGYRIYNNEYLYYFLENGYTYEVKNGGLDKIENIYDNIDINILDITKIKESIYSIDYRELDNKYIYNLEDRIITIYSLSDNTLNILIDMENSYYHLIFSDINLVKEITY